MKVHIGDSVKRKPLTVPKDAITTMGRTVMEGRVVYVHPRERFHVVEFPVEKRGGPRGITEGIRAKERRGIRESFFGVEQ